MKLVGEQNVLVVPTEDEMLDEATLTTASRFRIAIVEQSVAFAASFSVPSLYFRVTDEGEDQNS